MNFAGTQPAAWRLGNRSRPGERARRHPFSMTKQLGQLREAVRDHIAKGEPCTLAALAARLGVSRQAVSFYRKRIAPHAPRLTPGPRRTDAIKA